MKQDQSYFRQVFYLREDNFGLNYKENIAFKISFKIVALFTENYPSEDAKTIASIWCPKQMHQAIAIKTHKFTGPDKSALSAAPRLLLRRRRNRKAPQKKKKDPFL